MATIRRDHTGKNKKAITTVPLTLRSGRLTSSTNSFPTNTNNYLIAQYQHYSSSSPKRPNYLRSTVSSTITIGVSKKPQPNDNIAPKPTITRRSATPLVLKPRLSTNTNTKTSIPSPSPFTVKTNVVPRKPVQQTPASQKPVIPPKPVPQKPKILRAPTKDPIKQRASSSSSNKPAVSTIRKSINKRQETRNTTSTVTKEKIRINVASHQKVEKHTKISNVPQQVTQPRDQEPSIVECDDHVSQPHYQESSIVEGDDHQTEQVIVTKCEKGTDDHKKEQLVTEDERGTDDHQKQQAVSKNDKVIDDHQKEQVVSTNKKGADDHQKEQVVSTNKKSADDHQKEQVVSTNEKGPDDHKKEQVVSTNKKGADDHQKEQFVSTDKKGADDHQKEQVVSKHEKGDDNLEVNDPDSMSVGKKKVETETVVPEVSRLLEEPSSIIAVKKEEIEEKPSVEELASSEKQELREHDANEVNQSIACEVKLRITCKSVEKDNPPSEEAKKKEGNELNNSGIEAQETKEIQGKQFVEEKKQKAGNIAAAAVQEKKESTVSNDAIEETASKLREQRRNRVKALAGAFETVISKHEHK